MDEDAGGLPGCVTDCLTVLFVLLALAVASLLARAAPAPRKRPPAARPSIVGAWSFTWGSHQKGDVAWFSRDGYWACHWGGGDYVGTWTLKGDVLRVQEWVVGTDGLPLGSGYRWSARLRPGKLAGRLGEELAFGDDDFALAPLPGGRRD